MNSMVGVCKVCDLLVEEIYRCMHCGQDGFCERCGIDHTTTEHNKKHNFPTHVETCPTCNQESVYVMRCDKCGDKHCLVCARWIHS